MKRVTNFMLLSLAIFTLTFTLNAGDQQVEQIMKSHEYQVEQITKKTVIKLKTLLKAKMQGGDLEGAKEIEKVIANLGGSTAKKMDPAGSYLFEYKGKERAWIFKKDGKVYGQYFVSGNKFTGTWKVKEDSSDEVQIFVGKDMFATIKEEGNSKYKISCNGKYNSTATKVE